MFTITIDGRYNNMTTKHTTHNTTTIYQTIHEWIKQMVRYILLVYVLFLYYLSLYIYITPLVVDILSYVCVLVSSRVYRYLFINMSCVILWMCLSLYIIYCMVYTYLIQWYQNLSHNSKPVITSQFILVRPF